MNRDDRSEERLAKLIGATRAPANPAVLARARARIAARAGAPGVAVWLGRPAVLAGAGVLFVLCVVGALAVSQRPSAPASDTGLIASLLGEEDLGLPIGTSSAEVTNGAAAEDSGEVSP